MTALIIIMKFTFLKSTNPYFNLAVEEYLLKHTNEEYFLLWQNEPTVVIGKNQNVFAEINIPYTKENGIYIARRITGGGAVYHDLGNINYSFISEKQGNDIDFERFSRPIIEALADIGISAALSGRNDIMVGDKKISGNAQTMFESRVLHHGTLLFDSDLDRLSSALLVDERKFKAKGIKSTRSRVANINTFLDREYAVKDFIEKIKSHIFSKYDATKFEIENNEIIESLYKRNKSDSWLYPERDYLSRFSINVNERYKFGTISIFLDMKNDIITKAKIEGDFFGTRDISEIEELLSKNSLSNIDRIISKITVSDYILGMTNEEFINLMKK